MNNQIKSISREAEAAIYSMSEIVHDKNMSNEEKSSKLKELSPFVNKLIDGELKQEGRLIFGAEFILKKIDKFIESGDFEKMPEPKILSKTFEELNATVAALSACVVSGLVDLSTMFKLLIDVVSKFRKYKAEDFREHMKQIIEVALAQKTLSDTAAEQQKSAEVAQHVTTIVCQTVSIAANAVLIGVDSNTAKKQKSNADTEANLDGFEVEIKGKGKEVDELRKDARQKARDLSAANNNPQMTDKNRQAIKSESDKINAEYKSAFDKYKNQVQNYKDARRDLKISDAHYQNLSSQTRTLGQINQSGTQIFQSVGGAASSGEKLASAKSKNEADLIEAKKSLLQNMSQSDMDFSQKLSDFSAQVIQSLSAAIDKDDQTTMSVIKG